MKDWKRIFHSLRMCLILSPMKRAEYLKKKKIFYHVGTKCMVMFRKIPLYPRLISLGNNVWIASNVSLITHDVIHHMLNIKRHERLFTENLGCIDIKDNVFIGANTIVLPNVSIGPNVIIAAGSIVNRDIKEGVYAGTPAKYIGSFEDFSEKRRKSQLENIYKESLTELSPKTISDCWDRFLASR